MKKWTQILSQTDKGVEEEKEEDNDDHHYNDD